MQNFIKSGNKKLWFYIGSIALMAVLWKFGEAINSKLASLPIKTAPKAVAATATIDQKSFYAVWVKRITSSAPETIENDQAVEDLFRKKEEVVIATALPEKPPGPDYVQIFKQNANISGVSDDGIFINRRFYAIGQKLENLAMASESGTEKPIIPVLNSIQKGKVTFVVGNQKVIFLIGNE